MPHTDNDDEFDLIPDAFEGINFDAIPELNPIHSAQPHEEPDSSEIFSDPFEGVDWSTIPELNLQDVATGSITLPDGPSAVAEHGNYHTTPSDPSSEGRSSESTHISLDNVDEADLEELEVQEIDMNHPRSGPTDASILLDHHTSSDANASETASQLNGRIGTPDGVSEKKRKCHSGSSQGTPRKKRKRRKGKKFDIEAGVKLALEQFEEELSCPICCDILASAHMGNPCGHTFCGECGWGWISKNRTAPTCAICRAKLNRAAPMIPNYIADNLVTKHVCMLPVSGDTGWLPGGPKYTEWAQRTEKWKTTGAKEQSKKRR